MLKHIVLLEPADADGLERIKSAMEILETLPGKLPGIVDFYHGPNLDFEAKSERYSYGFVVTFADKAANDAYVDDPDHQRAGGMLVAACKDGHHGIFVADLEV